MSTQTLIFSMMVTAMLIGLVWLAGGGSVIAVIILTVITTILVFMTGALLTIKTVRVMNDRTQQQFYDNAQENLSIIQQLQQLQNQQNTQLLKQVKQLPQSNGYRPVFEIDDAVFDELN